jgi:hypothetical protein
MNSNGFTLDYVISAKNNMAFDLDPIFKCDQLSGYPDIQMFTNYEGGW